MRTIPLDDRRQGAAGAIEAGRFALSVDSGGTKMRAVLFDADLRYVASGEGGGANANFDAAASIREQSLRCLAPCLEACAPGSIARAYVTALGAADAMKEALLRHSPGCEVLLLSEGEACLRAGLGRREGTVALAGTGSIAFGIEGGAQTALGGWGSWIGDEGSGYDIGRRAIAAAIRAAEGRGPRTALTEAIVDGLGLGALEELLGRLHGAPSPRAFVASVCPIAAAAARGGDAVALAIFEAAGEELASLTAAMLDGRPALRSRPVTVAGSAWKGCRAMFERFERELTAKHPGVAVALPAFEPVVGGVFEEAFARFAERSRGARTDASPPEPPANALPAEARRTIEAEFERFRYRTAWN